MTIYGVYIGDEYEGFHLMDKTVYVNLEDAIKAAEDKIKEDEMSDWNKIENHIWITEWEDKMKIDTIQLKGLK